MEHLVDVVPFTTLRGALSRLTYRVPEGVGDLDEGDLVAVPLKGRYCLGLVVERGEGGYTGEVKAIASLLGKNFLSPALLRLLSWMSIYYHTPLGRVLQMTLPVGLTHDLRVWVEARGEDPLPGGRQRLRLETLKQKLGRGAQNVLEAKRRTGAWRLQFDLRAAPPKKEGPVPPSGETLPLVLNAEQQEALQRLQEALQSKHAALLQGVTGSGKTEVYLSLIRSVLHEGRRVLILFPEVALTPLMIKRFSAYFDEPVAVWHSYLPLKERQATYDAVRRGAFRLHVGARSALFLPIPDLGLIVLDEEQEGSYKQEQAPRYRAREVAMQRAKLENASLLFSSATPSLETYHLAARRRIGYACLKERYGGSTLPLVEILDMRGRWGRGIKILHPRAAQNVEQTLKAGKQVLLLLNRRGYAPHCVCQICGLVVRCDACDVGMVFHQASASLVCHHCGKIRPDPKRCPACGAAYIRYAGIGTERLESFVQRRFAGARVLRVDLDSVSDAAVYQRKLLAFEAGEYDILVGTQMIAKGFDLPGVHLCVVLSPDFALRLPDFRAAERTFQLLVQLAGRAGRRQEPGHVLIQTLEPDHEVYRLAAEQDVEGFYRRELSVRRRHFFPPFAQMAVIQWEHKDQARLSRIEEEICRAIGIRGAGKHVWNRGGERIEVLGPAPCPLQRRRGRWRRQLLVKASASKVLHPLLHQVEARASGHARWIKMDVDPVQTL